MTTIKREDIKKGDRIRWTREATVVKEGRIGRSLQPVIEVRDEDGRTFFLDPTLPQDIELVERPLPEEPPIGSIVVFHFPSGLEAWKRWGDHLGWLHAGNSTPQRRRDGRDRQGLTWQQLLTEPTRSVERTVITP